jgi:hypothetical protein
MAASRACSLHSDGRSLPRPTGRRTGRRRPVPPPIHTPSEVLPKRFCPCLQIPFSGNRRVNIRRREVAGSSAQPTGAKYLMLTPIQCAGGYDWWTCSLLATQLRRCSCILRVLTSQVAKLRSEVTRGLNCMTLPMSWHEWAQHDGTALAARLGGTKSRRQNWRRRSAPASPRSILRCRACS